MRGINKLIQRSLCGLLFVAMMLTSLSVPTVNALAVEVLDEEVVDIVDDEFENDLDSENEVVSESKIDEIDLYTDGATSTNFYYYVGDVDGGVDVCANVWCGTDGNFSSTVEDTIDLNGWSTTYIMSPVAGHDGWYSMPMSFQNDGLNTTIKIILSTDTAVENPLFTVGEWNNADIYALMTSGENADSFVKDGTFYTSFEDAEAVTIEYPITITLNMYSDEDIDSLDFVWWDGSPFSTSASATKETIAGSWSASGYKMTPVADNDGWYSGEFNTNSNGSGSGFAVWAVKDGSSVSETEISAWNNTDILASILAVPNGGSIAIRGGKAYDSIDDAEYDVLPTLIKSLISSADGYDQSLYTEDSWSNLEEKKAAASDAVGALEDADEGNDPSIATLRTVYAELKEAIDNLETEKALSEINVSPVALSSDFITGADFSSYLAIRDSGVVFKDENGNALSDQEFFNYVKEGGTNWVRIRVWNDPYDGSGNGYGGGNNDLEKAVTIGKLATNAGMRVLIDFHYSDFWADPAKYSAPKAFKNLSVDDKAEAVREFTTSSLRTLKNAGVDVGMVQVGNETNSGICGETTWDNMAKIFKAGSEAVRTFDEDILIAVHYTDPQNGFDKYASKLDSYGVDYDVFGASFYPYWHGTTSKLTESLSEVATKYGKKVMVAETSWATTWEDGDGHDNSAPKTTGQALNYDISIQGQADEMRDVVNAVNSATKGIGVFYWEPAWLSPNYVYNSDGSIDSKLLAENKTGWEKYGAGWASSYSAEYDPSDAGLWYGGSAVDNQSWFDFDGTALPTAKAYALIRTGAEAKKAISQFSVPEDIEVSIGGTVEYPTEINVKFNDGTKGTAAVKWNVDDKALVSTDKIGKFNVRGVASCTYDNGSGSVTEKKDVSIVVSVLAKANLLKNPGFESGYNTNWIYSGTTPDAAKTGTESNNVRTGAAAVNFYFSTASDFTMSQTVKGINPGIYTFGAFMQGGSAGSNDKQYSFAEVYDSEDNLKVKYTAKTSLSGWLNWNDPKITGIKVDEGDYLVVGLNIMSTEDGAWGWIDDAYLYGSHSVNASEDIVNGQLTLSNYEASAGEVITVTATPNAAYKLKNLTFAGVDSTFAPSIEGTYSEETGIYNIDFEASNITSAQNVTFTMPETEVTVAAEFVSLFGSDKIDISTAEGLTVTIDSQFATGRALTPAVKVVYNGYVLTTADYAVTFKNNKDAYTYTSEDDDFDESKAPTAIIKAKGTKFTGTKTVNFIIKDDVRIDLANKNSVELVLTEEYDNPVKKSFFYTGDEIEPSIAINYKDGDGTSTLDPSKYSVVYTTNIKPGKATITVVPADDSVKNSLQATFTIAKRPLLESAGIKISAPSGATYSGKAVKPLVRVKYGNKTLSNGTDYTVAYSGNTKASEGVAYLIVTGKGNYEGKSDKIYFNISKKNIADTAITMTADTLNATGKDQTAKITLLNTVTNKKLTTTDYYVKSIEKYDEEASDYVEITGLKFKDAGTYRVTVGGVNNYTGERKAVFKVTDAAHNISNFTLKTVPMTYTGSAIKLNADELKVTYKSGKETITLEEGTDFTTKYLNNQKVGTATVTITGKGDYSGTKSTTFRITQAKIKKAYDAAKEDISADDADYVQWNLAVLEGKVENTSYTGYAITPALKVTYGPNKNVLVKDKDYTVSFSNNVKSGAKATITIKGKGNYSGSATIKEAFEVEDKKLSDFVISVAPVEYSGKAIKPAITFTDKITGENVDLKVGTAYSVTYKNNTNVAGKNSLKAPEVIIKETGLNGTVAAKDKSIESYKFTITTSTIKSNCVADIAVQKYANKPVTPNVSVKVNGRALRVNKDYVATYSNNGKPGIATVTITGIGNYTGTVTKKFTIR